MKKEKAQKMGIEVKMENKCRRRIKRGGELPQPKEEEGSKYILQGLYRRAALGNGTGTAVRTWERTKGSVNLYEL